MLHIFNSLTKRKEKFVPITPDVVKMYVCGMTVYDFCHLGHGRVMVIFDIVKIGYCKDPVDNVHFYDLKDPDKSYILEKTNRSNLIPSNFNDTLLRIYSRNKNKTPLLIGYHRRHNSIVSKVKGLIDKGKLGNIVSANVLCWLYKHKAYYKEKWRISKGGGPLGINLVHDLDMICYLLGPITYVQAFTSNKVRKYKIEDTASINLTFKSGALCTINVSDTIVSPWSYELTSGENPAYPITNQSSYFIGGTKGSIQFPNINIWYYKNERSWWNSIFSKKIRTTKSNETLINQVDHFSKVVQRKSKPKVTGEDGLVSLKIFDAITKSASTGKKIKV